MVENYGDYYYYDSLHEYYLYRLGKPQLHVTPEILASWKDTSGDKPLVFLVRELQNHDILIFPRMKYRILDWAAL